MTTSQGISNITCSTTFYTTDWTPVCALGNFLRKTSWSSVWIVFDTSFATNSSMSHFVSCAMMSSFLASVFSKTVFMFCICLIISGGRHFSWSWLASVIQWHSTRLYRCVVFLIRPLRLEWQVLTEANAALNFAIDWATLGLDRVEGSFYVLMLASFRIQSVMNYTSLQGYFQVRRPMWYNPTLLEF